MYKSIDIINELNKYSQFEKEKWMRRIINTNMPMLCVQMPDIKKVISLIKKEEYISYLENETFDYYENTIIYIKILSKLKSYEDFKKYLFKLLPHIDNWSTCDAIEINFKKEDFSCLYELSKQLVIDKHSFTRRVSIRLLFKMLNYEDETLKAFEIIKQLENEKEYYVNMILAWFLCEAFIKQKELTLPFLCQFKNEFVLRKTISKCRDSFRVSKMDKDFLKTLIVN